MIGDKKIWRILACFSFIMFIVQLFGEINFFIIGDYPRIIEDKGQQLFATFKTAVCAAFFYGIWRGHI